MIRTDLDVHLVTLAIDGITGWSYPWYREGGGLAPEEIGESVSRACVTGAIARQRPICSWWR
ncbi:hypothetical protein [Pseudonocardia endophytica]|uniref:hypothetical protein n=1 Tax=Pseudonocardia endophytica TaxID=401976 RepID=UPI003C76DC4C